jgi:hypothetical protein
MDLKSKLLDPAQTVLLYGTTPPRLGTPEEQVSAAAGKLAGRIAALPLDGVVVYDIQDETGRTQLPRPFPFTHTIDPRQYSMQLMESTGLPAITYKALGNLDEASWRTWLTQSHGIEFISVVGRPASGVRYALPLSKAIRIAASDAGGLTIGGVVIAERHTVQRSEAARLLAKGIEGCGYFISHTSSTSLTPARFRSASMSRACRSIATRSTPASTCSTRCAQCSPADEEPHAARHGRGDSGSWGPGAFPVSPAAAAGEPPARPLRAQPGGDIGARP